VEGLSFFLSFGTFLSFFLFRDYTTTTTTTTTPLFNYSIINKEKIEIPPIITQSSIQ